MTAKEWRDKNPNLNGNIRDYTDILHLVVLANLENLNAEMITNGVSQSNRLIQLNNIVKKQLELLKENSSVKRLEKVVSQHIKFIFNINIAEIIAINIAPIPTIVKIVANVFGRVSPAI